jgi:hypothetical protein
MSRKDERKEHWLTPSEVGELAGGLTGQFIREEIECGNLEAIYIQSRGDKRQRGRYRIRRSAADAYAAKLEREAGQASVPRGAHMQ